jgi:ferrous iron transport protein A
MSLTLDKIPIGSRVKVKDISGSSFKRRLMDMGIVSGLEISVEGKAPLGDPIEVLVRGYRLTLRKSEAMSVLVGEEVE